MSYFHIHLWSEQRLLAFASNDREQRLEQALDSAATFTVRPVSATNLSQELERLNTWGSTEVLNVRPSIKSRMYRSILGASASVIGKEGAVYDATTAEVVNAIDRQAYQRMTIAEKQMNDAEYNSLDQIRKLSRITKMSAGFLKHKVEICDRLKTDLEKELANSQQSLNAAVSIRSFDRSQLKRSVEALKVKLNAVKHIGGDTNKKLEGSMVGQMHHDIDTAVKYFTDTCSAYLPETAGNVQMMIQSYVEGGTIDLERLIHDIAVKMYPDDENLQKAQEASMRRIAQKMTGDQSMWRKLRRRFVELVPGTIAGVGTGFVTGGIGWGVAVASLTAGGASALRGANNQLRYGTPNKLTFERSQAASYFNSVALENVKKINEIKAAKDISEKFNIIKALPSGTKIKVDVLGVQEEVTLTTITGNIRLATSASGDRYAIELEGGAYTSGGVKEYLVAIQKRGGTVKEIKKIVANDAPGTDSILSFN